MITLGTTFKEVTCPTCKKSRTVIIRTEVSNMHVRRVVLDACPRCNCKLSKYQELDRELTSDEIDKLYPNGKTKPQIKEL